MGEVHGIRTDIPLDLGDLPRQWARLKTLYAAYDALPDNPSGPVLVDRYVDEQQTAGHRLYIGAAGHIDNAREHNDILRHLVNEVGPTPRVPWTVLRGVFESGFWACWLLEPRDGPERRKRGLRLEYLGHKQRQAFYKDYLRMHPDIRATVMQDLSENTETYKREAEDMGLSWALANQKIDVVGELERLEVVKSLDDGLEGQAPAVWRSLSGAQHGHAYALVHHSDLVEKAPVLGGRLGQVTVKDSALQTAWTMAHILHVTAVSLFVRRSTELVR